MEIKLNRTGKRPIVFEGERIADLNTKVAGSSRWTKCEVFKTQDGKIVVGVANLTCHLGESDCYRAEVFDNQEAAVKYLERRDSDIAGQIATQLGVSEHIK